MVKKKLNKNLILVQNLKWRKIETGLNNFSKIIKTKNNLRNPHQLMKN